MVQATRQRRHHDEAAPRSRHQNLGAHWCAESAAIVCLGDLHMQETKWKLQSMSASLRATYRITLFVSVVLRVIVAHHDLLFNFDDVCPDPAVFDRTQR